MGDDDEEDERDAPDREDAQAEDDDGEDAVPPVRHLAVRAHQTLVDVLAAGARVSEAAPDLLAAVEERVDDDGRDGGEVEALQEDRGVSNFDVSSCRVEEAVRAGRRGGERDVGTHVGNRVGHADVHRRVGLVGGEVEAATAQDARDVVLGARVIEGRAREDGQVAAEPDILVAAGDLESVRKQGTRRERTY